MCGLLRDPQIGATTTLHAEPAFNSERHRRRDRGTLGLHARECGARPAQLTRGIGHRKAQRRPKTVVKGERRSLF